MDGAVRLLRGSYKNFCSYAELEFDYSNLGLTLVSGPTGSGKSTLMDAAAWCLYGQTSKEGAADEIKAWGADEPTAGVQEVETPQGTLTVTRIRGRPQQNDLYWTEAADPETKIRGKDAIETQKNLDVRLGVTAELYFTSAYFHQFSRADSFFIAKSKDRRDLLERIADLSLPIRIGERASEHRKLAKASLYVVSSTKDRFSGRLEALISEVERTERAAVAWSGAQAEAIKRANKASAGFESDKQNRRDECNSKLRALLPRLHDIERNKKQRQEIESLRPAFEKAQKDFSKVDADIRALKREYEKFSASGAEICPTCLGNTDNPNKANHLQYLTASIDTLSVRATGFKAGVDEYAKSLSLLPALNLEYESLLVAQRKHEAAKAEYDKVEQSVNTHAAELERLQAESNPHEASLARSVSELEETDASHEFATKEVAELEKRVVYLTQVYDLSLELRGLLLEKTVQELEAKTNANLETYFDGEIKVTFTLDGDKLEAAIQKNGYNASFRQLSGGQRGILKVSFGVALMEAAANKAGVNFNVLFFDEALNGLDDNLKVKAFGLFQKLESDHESVIMIDHSEEFKSMFAKRYQVSLEGDTSTISQLGDA